MYWCHLNFFSLMALDKFPLNHIYTTVSIKMKVLAVVDFLLFDLTPDLVPHPPPSRCLAAWVTLTV